jgi:hypothetical protein
MSIPVPLPIGKGKPIRRESTNEKCHWDKYNKLTYLPLRATKTVEVDITSVYVPFPKHISVAPLQIPRFQSRIHATNLTKSNSNHLASMEIPTNEFGDEIIRPTTAMQLTNPGLYGRSSLDTAKILGKNEGEPAVLVRKSLSAIRTFDRTQSTEFNKENEQACSIKTDAEKLKRDLEISRKDVEKKKRGDSKPEEILEALEIRREADLLKKQVEVTRKEVEAKRKKIERRLKERPETTDITARRLIGRAMGINLAKKTDEKTLRVEASMRQRNEAAKARK